MNFEKFASGNEGVLVGHIPKLDVLVIAVMKLVSNIDLKTNNRFFRLMDKKKINFRYYFELG